MKLHHLLLAILVVLLLCVAEFYFNYQGAFIDEEKKVPQVRVVQTDILPETAYIEGDDDE